MDRNMAYAGLFYPAETEDCRQLLEHCLYQCCKKTTPVRQSVAGIVPHAGWVYSGNTAAEVFHAISQGVTPRTFIIFGAIHVPGVPLATVWQEGDWQTPLGDVEIDRELATALAQADPKIITANPNAHTREHSIEVEVPFIKHLFPEAMIVPVMVPPQNWAWKIGEYAANLCGNDVVALGSTDLTHYGERFGFCPAGTGPQALEWVKRENDRRMIELMLALHKQDVVAEARQNSNACGAGAIAATLSFAQKRGRKKGFLLDYTTSWDVHPEKVVDSFVGYSGIVF